jgi:hypothetical protein
MMQTRQVVHTLEDPHLVTVFVWVIILFHGLPKATLLFLGPQLKRSIVWWLILWLERFGYVNFSWSYIDQLSVLLLLLWQHLSSLHGVQSSTTSSNLTHWDWHSFCSRESCIRRGSRSSCSNKCTICWYLHQGFPTASFTDILPTSTSWRPTLTLRGDIVHEHVSMSVCPKP